MDPGAIDNATLLGTDGELYPRLSQNFNYHGIPIPTWDLLVGWYGLNGPLHAFKREVVMEKDYTQTLKPKLEVYLMTVEVFHERVKTKKIKLQISKTKTYGDLKSAMCDEFGLPDDETTRVWEYAYKPSKLMEPATKGLHDWKSYTPKVSLFFKFGFGGGE